MSLQSNLEELLARHNGDVLPLTIHVLRGPTRIALLCADGNRREYRITDAGATAIANEATQPPSTTERAVAVTMGETGPDGTPPPIRIDVQGFQDAMFYGKPAGEA